VGNFATPVAPVIPGEIAVQQSPESRQIRFARALELERAGRAAESLELLLGLETEARDSPELLVHVGRALAAANRAAEAETRITDALAHWPTSVELHILLAELRWQRGAGADSLRWLEAAIDAHPRELGLRLVAAGLLRNMENAPRALELLEAGLARAPESAAFLTSLGVVLDDLDRSREALGPLRAAIPRARNPATAMLNLASVLLRTGDAAEALEIFERLIEGAPDDQKFLAYRATALRLLGDPRHAALCDHQRFVRTYRLVPPPEYADIAAFNAAFARELDALHFSTQRPLAQSLRGGTQTERRLPADNPVIAQFFAMLDAPIRDYIGRLDRGDATHPTTRRARDGYRIGGSWSVKLAPGGFHTNHVHPEGWLSSAYYVEVPPMDDGSRAAWLKFGEPGVRVDLPPEHFVRPEPGLLVLFPSFFWHGTVPFQDGGGRLTAAFDVLPA
jgi:tetratricopeptide (TPR) repeat protein